MKLYNTPLTFVYKLNFLLIILIVSSSMTNNDRYMLEALKNDNTDAPPTPPTDGKVAVFGNGRYWESYIT